MDLEYCDQCADQFLLDITQVPYKCIDCPTECGNDCSSESGCDTCIPGYFRTEITSKNEYKTKMHICKKCSEECKECVGSMDICTSCPEYYQVKNSKCEFAYLHYVIIGLGVLVLVLVGIIIVVVRCVCMVKAPERPSFGSILDKDPDLQSDYIKYDIQTIGNGSQKNNSFISVVEQQEDQPDYLNMTNFSQDPIISQLLGPSSHQVFNHSEVAKNHNDQYNFDINGEIQTRSKNGTTKF